MQGIGKTDIGIVRTNNEDSIFVSNEAIGNLPNLYIVADGMGGHKAGEVASSKSIEFFCQYAQNNISDNMELLDFIISAMTFANDSVKEIAELDMTCFGMGTTFTTVVISQNKAFIGHIGDSRVYLIRDNKIEQLTSDHSYVNELVKAGQITAEEAKYHPERNKITRVLGMVSPILADGKICEILPGDQLFLCSDGVTTMLEDDELLNILLQPTDSSSKVESIINEANRRGGNDNSSVILIC